MLETGQKVGKYEIIRMLGEGGTGRVYLARDCTLLRLSAVKQMRGEHEEWVLREAGFLRDLRHPMLPMVYDLLREKDWYLAMEYVEGISLHNYIKKTGPVGEEIGRIWAESLLSILEYLHNRKPPVIYRDLKPENIMVCQDKSLRLVDFGAACLKDFGEDTGRGMALTRGYGAPEQQAVTGRPVYADERSDIYAFGRVLYYMLTGANPGEPPYGSLPVSAYNPLLGKAIERVIEKCTRENPLERYQIAGEIRQDLSLKSRGSRRDKRKAFVRHVEKRVWLTEKVTAGL